MKIRIDSHRQTTGALIVTAKLGTWVLRVCGEPGAQLDFPPHTELSKFILHAKRELLGAS